MWCFFFRKTLRVPATSINNILQNRLIGDPIIKHLPILSIHQSLQLPMNEMGGVMSETIA